MSVVPWLLFALALLFRAFGCANAGVPGFDGIHYLWLGSRFADGHLEALYATVFHPLYPLLIAGGLGAAPGVDAFRVGQAAAALPAAVAVVPLWYATRTLFGARAATWAGVLYAIGTWFVRHPAECMSEGPFYLLATSWLWATLSPRHRGLLAGAFAGLAFLARPEGIALGLVGSAQLWLAGLRGAALRHAAAAGGFLLLYPLGAWVAGEGFVLTPKAAFNWDVGAGAADAPWTYYLTELARLPGIALEGVGYAALPLAIAGAVLRPPRQRTDAGWLLLAPFLLQCAVVPLLRSHYRFVSGFGVLLLPYAGHAFTILGAALARRPAWLRLLPLLAVFGAEAKLYVQRPVDRTIERELGTCLRLRLGAGERVASDMPRVEYYAGQEPPPPRRIRPTDLLQAAGEAGCRFVALRSGRTAIRARDLEALGYRETALPDPVATHPHRAEVQLFAR